MIDYTKLVADTLQKGYRDATQTELDYKVASSILTTLREAGWVDLETVAALVASAGGSIKLQDKYFNHPPDKVWIEERQHLGYRKISVEL